MIDLRQLRQFIAVAEELHFHRAARRLNMSQPPLTATVRRLEGEIGAELLERGNRVVRLTPAGKALLAHARLTIEQADLAVAAARDAAAGRAGTLRLTYVGSAMYGRLAKAVRAFRRSFANVQLELREATTAAQVLALREGTSDLAVLLPPLPDAAGLDMLPFDEDCFAIALPAAHRLAGKANLALSDLADEPLIMWPAAEGRGFHTQVVRHRRRGGAGQYGRVPCRRDRLPAGHHRGCELHPVPLPSPASAGCGRTELPGNVLAIGPADRRADERVLDGS